MGVIASDTISLISTETIYDYSAKAISSATQLWFTKANTTKPEKPTSVVTSTSTAGNGWRTIVPTYDTSYPYYYYCFQYQYRNGTYGWGEVVYDRATTEAQATANAASGEIADYITSNNAVIETLQSQIDGQIEAWYIDGVPGCQYDPALNWTTLEVKQRHLGDLYFDINTGHSWRYLAIDDTDPATFSWEQIPDSDAAAALAAAQNAQAIATSKRRIFTSTPTVPYDVGDMWIDINPGSGRVPEGYVEVEYVAPQSAVDLGIKTTDETKIEAEWMWCTSTAQYLYLSDSSSSGTTNTTAYISTGSGYWRFGNRYTSVSTVINSIMTTLQEAQGVTVNGILQEYSTVSSFESTNTLRIASASGGIRFYSLKIWSGDTLIFDLVPVRKSDNTAVGFINIVDDSFWSASNTDTSDCGEDVEIPAAGTVIKFSSVSRSTGSFVPGDWHIAATDDSTAQAAQDAVGELEEQTVTAIVKQYNRSSSNETADGTWQNTIPEVVVDTYLWTRDQLIYADGAIEYTTPVCVSEYTTDIVRPAIDASSAVLMNYAAGLITTEREARIAAFGQYALQSSLDSWVAWAQSQLAVRDNQISMMVTQTEVTDIVNDLGEVQEYTHELGNYLTFDAVDGLTLSALNSAVTTVFSNTSWQLRVQGTPVQQVDAEEGAQFSSLTLKALSDGAIPKLVLGDLTIVVESDGSVTGRKTG